MEQNDKLKGNWADADTSNAGDDYHILWACRQAMKLLNFDDSGLKALVIEGPSPNDSIEPEEEESLLLGIDLAEYWGGDNFQNAQRVNFIQLKYSTKHPSKEWTLSRLCEGKRHKHSGSVIHRLAQAFQKYNSDCDSTEVLQKLNLQLISNQAINNEFNKQLKQIQQYIKDNPTLRNLPELKNGLSNQFDDEIDRLKSTATALRVRDFFKFLTLLDFEDCGTTSRFFQKMKLVEAIGQVLSEGVGIKRHYDALSQLIREKMQPEGRANPNIVKNDILYLFEYGSIDSIFPAPPKFEDLPFIIERSQLKSIGKTISDSSSVICLHGNAGIGKSTAAINLQKHLPENSVVIHFDCYGGGTYLDPAEIRHRHSRAICQLANELSSKGGTDLLIQKNDQPENLLRALKNRIETATKLITSAYPDALIVFIIDAADNSITAAEQNNENSFVHDLVRMNYPDHFRLIVSSRTHRVESLKLLETAVHIEILPFSKEETGYFLKNKNIEHSEEQRDEFWNLTSGIPRVQKYALSIQGKSFIEILELLKPDGKTVGLLIDEQIEFAKKKIGDTELLNQLLFHLITLPRPIPISYLADIAGINASIIRDCCVDFWSGIVLNNDLISFRDEDFENHLREKFKGENFDYSSTADFFLKKSETNEYAAFNLGDILFKAGKFEVLQEITLNRKLLSAISDNLRRREAFIKRSQLALKSATDQNETLLYSKLLFVVAEAAKTNEALLRVIRSNPELAAYFSDPEIIKSKNLRLSEDLWYGQVNYQWSAVFSRKTESHLKAKKLLQEAKDWFKWWIKLPSDRRELYDLTFHDIAFSAEAQLRLTGVKAATSDIQLFKKKSTVWNVAELFVKNLIEKDAPEQLKSWWKEAPKRFDFQLLVIQSFRNYGLIPPVNIEVVQEKWDRLITRNFKFKTRLNHSIVTTCEYLIQLKIAKVKVLEYLQTAKVKIPQSRAHFLNAEEKVELNTFAKFKVLESYLTDTPINFDSLYPKRIQTLLISDIDINKKNGESDKKEFDEFYNFIIPFYKLRLEYKLGLVSDAELIKNIEGHGKNRRERHSISENHRINPTLLHLAELMAELVFNFKKPQILIDQLKGSLGNRYMSRIALRRAILEVIAPFSKLQKEILKLLNEIKELNNEKEGAAREKIDVYLACADLALKTDFKAGEYYYNLAINMAEEIDIDVMDQIKCLSYIIDTKQRTCSNPQLTFELGRFVEYTYPKVSGWDGFPWHPVTKAMVHLAPLTALSVFCRWDHRGFREIDEDYSEKSIRSLFEKGKVSPIFFTSYLDYLPFGENFEAILQKFNEKGLHREKNDFLRSSIKRLKLNGSVDSRKSLAFKMLKVIDKESSITPDVISELKDYSAFFESFSTEKQDDTPNRPSPKQPEDEPARKIYEESWENIDLTNSNSIAIVLTNHSHNPEDFHYRNKADDLFDFLKSKCSPEKYLDHLNAICQLEPKVISFYSFEETISSRLKDWNYYPGIDDWKKAAFEKVLKNWFNYFVFGGYSVNTWGINNLSKIFGATSEELAKILIKLLPTTIERLSSESVYALLPFVNPLLTSEQADTSVQWNIARSLDKPDIEFPDGEWRSELEVPEDTHIVLARFFRYGLGHPDKRIRWKFAHRLRRLVLIGECDMLPHLIKEKDETYCPGFQHENHIFFWLSSKLWLFFVINRLAKEVPEKIAPYSKEFYREAVTKSTTHLLIRFLAKSICRSLLKFDKSIFSKKEKKALKKAAKSPFKRIKENDLKDNPPEIPIEIDYVQFEYEITPEVTFDFDTLDTTRYWYKYLAQCFGVPTIAITKGADNQIRSVWNFKGDSRKENHVDLDWQLMSNGHGALPTIENLRLYFEYHSMFYIADQLLKNLPLVKDKFWNEKIESWLNRWTQSFAKHWLSEIRTPTPLEKRFYIDDRRKKENWATEIEEDFLDQAIFLKNNPNPEYLAVSGFYNRYFYDNRESVKIKSALVNPKTSHALLRALQTAYPHSAWLPSEKDHDRLEFHEDDFILKGWIREVFSENKGPEQFDTSFKKASGAKHVVGKEFVEFADLKFNNTKFESYREVDSERKIVTFFENWTDNSAQRSGHHSSFETMGSRLWVSKALLFEFLKEKNYDLIIKGHVSRRIDSRNFDPKKKDTEQTKIYIIKANGTVSTLEGDFKIR